MATRLTLKQHYAAVEAAEAEVERLDAAVRAAWRRAGAAADQAVAAVAAVDDAIFRAGPRPDPSEFGRTADAAEAAAAAVHRLVNERNQAYAVAREARRRRGRALARASRRPAA